MAKKHYSSKKAGMMAEKHSGHANLPTEVIMRDYPSSGDGFATFPYLDDTIEGIDMRYEENKRLMNKGMGKNIKY